MSNFSKENRLGGTYVMGGKVVSRVGYGAMQLPKLKDEAKARAVIRQTSVCESSPIKISRVKMIHAKLVGPANHCPGLGFIL